MDNYLYAILPAGVVWTLCWTGSKCAWRNAKSERVSGYFDNALNAAFFARCNNGTAYVMVGA